MKQLVVSLLFLLMTNLCVLAQTAKKPTIMVIPSDHWCTSRYFTKVMDNQGKKVTINDYEAAFREDAELYSVAAKIGEIMAANGYVNNSNPDANGVFQAIDVTLLGWDFAVWCRSLIAILYLVAGVMLFVGLGLIYNLDKKTLNKMTEELAARKAK